MLKEQTSETLEPWFGGQIALVTGASRGIGKAIAHELGRRGAFVLINYRSNKAEAQGTLESIEDAGGQGALAPFDVSDGEAAEDMLRTLSKKHGGLDILVNNAGIARDQILMRVKHEEISETFQTNVAAAIHLCKAAVRPMMRKKRGRIINISSVVAESGNPGQAVYSASKAALLGLTKTLAREYASRGITVNAVTPGFIETDMTSDLGEETTQALLKSIPLGRMGKPQDIANAVAFLASEQASYITGHVLRVNGGLYV